MKARISRLPRWALWLVGGVVLLALLVVGFFLLRGPLPARYTDARGVPMILVPAGPFMMGSDYHEPDERPFHQVRLSSYYIDLYEVTNARYAKCVAAGACKPPNDFSSRTRPQYYGATNYSTSPVIFVNWDQAQAYCQWRGARLSTEAEWEKAARGTDGRTYPWGNTFDGTKANFCDLKCPEPGHNQYYDGYEDTASVDYFPQGASPYGVYNLAGNVSEWVADWYDPGYYTQSPKSNPAGPPSGNMRILKGGDFGFPSLHSSDRWAVHSGFSLDTVGFRCAYSPGIFFGLIK